jgi:hypothetical protein
MTALKLHLRKLSTTSRESRRKVMNKGWTVWVGGSEINWQHYTHKIDAERIAEFWREVKGYDDVRVEEVA